jgi:hypothetical protein
MPRSLIDTDIRERQRVSSSVDEGRGRLLGLLKKHLA